MRRWGGIAVVLVAFGIAGCSATSFGSRSSSAEETAEMKRRIVELERQARVAQVEIERLRRQVAELRAADGSGSRPSAGPRAGSERRESAPPPSAPVESTPEAAPPVESSEMALENRLENRLEEPAVRATPPEGADPTAPPAAAGSRPSVVVTPEAQALYDRGYTLYHQSRAEDAEATFREFLQRHPDTELADNAQYWIGESRFAQGDVQGALAAFRQTVERFPQGNKVPDALLRAGDCMTQLGDEAGARSLYAEVVRLYPSTAAAAMAEERSANLP